MIRWFLWLLPAVAVAQPFSFGVKVGAPVTEAFNIIQGPGTFLADTKRFIIGPTAEIRFPFGLGIEADALYRRYEYNYAGSAGLPVPGNIASARTTSGAWEFPILAKYRSPMPLVKPFVAAGLSFSRLTGVKQTLSCFTGSCTQSLNDVAHDKNIGAVLGAGLQINVVLLKISPEIRYTRWGFANFNFGGTPSGSIKSNQNQVDVLVGLTF